jgi:hypothetical protein
MPRARPAGYINYIQPMPDEPRIAFQYGVTKQKTVELNLRFYDEHDIDETIQDWFMSTLMEGDMRVADIYLQALTETTHCIARYDAKNIMRSPKPEFTIHDLLPHVIEQYLDYPHIEHIIAEVYEPDNLTWRSKARYEELGFTVMYQDDIKIWMILNLL